MSYTTTTSNDTTYCGTIFCGTCNVVAPYPHYHINEWCDAQPTSEEPVPHNIDNILMDKLTAMRDTRDGAARYAQSKNDEASLHEIEAIRLRAQAGMMYREINEGVPMTPDKK